MKAPDCKCGHPESMHHATPSGRFACAFVEHGVSDRGIIGIPYTRRCECKDYKARGRRDLRAAKDEAGRS